MDISDMYDAVHDAKRVLKNADTVVNDLAYLLRGRLRKVDNPHHLRALKRELRDFDMTTGRWKR